MSRNLPTYTLLAVILMVISLVLGFANAEVQCSDVILKIIPCQNFLMSGESSPSVACCSGAQALDKEAAASQPDRQAICGCLKSAAQAFPVNVDKAAQLPTLCKLTTKIPINPTVDCSK
ncbi:non-specific lipid-transfer protein-like [Nicotiana tabacum]|uniref:Non-specific lipid-transfer protein n=2 Tax=Nicotiana TaxID=4085 RepID=A0A1S3YUY5_TOBAC